MLTRLSLGQCTLDVAGWESGARSTTGDEDDNDDDKTYEDEEGEEEDSLALVVVVFVMHCRYCRRHPRQTEPLRLFV